MNSNGIVKRFFLFHFSYVVGVASRRTGVLVRGICERDFTLYMRWKTNGPSCESLAQAEEGAPRGKNERSEEFDLDRSLDVPEGC